MDIVSSSWKKSEVEEGPVDVNCGYSAEEIAVLEAEYAAETQEIENNKALAKEIHDYTKRWLDHKENMTIEEVVHGAVFTALMAVDQNHRKKHPELLYESPRNLPSQLYADIVDEKRTEHFNTLMQNFISIIN